MEKREAKRDMSSILLRVSKRRKNQETSLLWKWQSPVKPHEYLI
jgi:hypothetical protein